MTGLKDGIKNWFQEDKPVLLKKNAMMNLPYIVDGDFVLTQTDPIINYLGRSTFASAAFVHVLAHYTVLIGIGGVSMLMSSDIAL